jgi:hypothetical protein
LRLPLGEQATRSQLLSALRGSRVEIGSGAARTTGRLLSIERIDRRGANGSVTPVDALSIISDAGIIRTIALDPGVSVRIVEAALNQEVGRYLALVASERDQDLRRLTIATTGTGDRDLFVSYVSEVPVWKRPPIGSCSGPPVTRQPLLQGWAIVYNTVGEGGMGQPVARRRRAAVLHSADLAAVLRAASGRASSCTGLAFAADPPASALGTAGAGALAGTVTDSAGGSIPGAPVHVTRNGDAAGDAVTDVSGRYRLTGLPPGAYEITFTMSGFRPLTRSNIAVSGGMETVLNATLQVGGMNEAVNRTMDSVAAMPAPAAPMAALGASRGGGGGGRGYGSGMGGPVSYADRLAISQERLQDVATSGQLGDLFEYKLNEPVTIHKNQSALVPILSGEVDAERVSLWNPSTGSRPLRAVWLTNTTGLTLDGGSFTVVEGQAFAGEGLIEPIKAGERRLLSYAVDLGVVVDGKGENVPTRVTRVQISRGVAVQQSEEKQRWVYTVRNEDTEPRAILIEHPARAGWTVTGTISPIETTPAWVRFRVPVSPKTTSTFTVDEARSLQTQFVINSITDAQVSLLVRDRAVGGPVEASLREVLARKRRSPVCRRKPHRARTNRSDGRDQQRAEKRAGAEGTSEKQLLQRHVRQLNDQETPDLCCGATADPQPTARRRRAISKVS